MIIWSDGFRWFHQTKCIPRWVCEFPALKAPSTHGGGRRGVKWSNCNFGNFAREPWVIEPSYMEGGPRDAYVFSWPALRPPPPRSCWLYQQRERNRGAKRMRQEIVLDTSFILGLGHQEIRREVADAEERTFTAGTNFTAILVHGWIVLSTVEKKF